MVVALFGAGKQMPSANPGRGAKGARRECAQHIDVCCLCCAVPRLQTTLYNAAALNHASTHPASTYPARGAKRAGGSILNQLTCAVCAVPRCTAPAGKQTTIHDVTAPNHAHIQYG